MKRFVSAMLLGGMVLGSLGGMRVSADDSSATTPPPSGGSHHDHGAVFKKACGEDIQKFCADQKGHELMACLKKNHDSLSADCQSAMKKMASHHGGKKPATPAAAPQGGTDSGTPTPQ